MSEGRLPTGPALSLRRRFCHHRRLMPADHLSRPEDRSPATCAAFAGMCLIWGSTFLAIRVGTESVPPLWGATLRLAIAAVLCFLVMRLTGGSFPRGAGLRAAFWFGFLNLGVNFVFLY